MMTNVDVNTKISDLSNFLNNYNILFKDESFVLKSGATVPSGFEKNIKFIESGERKCYFFPNKETDKSWYEFEKDCIKK